MPTRLDALRARLADLERGYDGDLTSLELWMMHDLTALLAVVEAAQDYRRNSLVLIGQDALGTALDTALAALTTEEE